MKKIFISTFFSLFSFIIFSSTTNYFSSSYQNFLEGKPNGVAVFPDGTFSLLTDFSEPATILSTPICSVSSGSKLFVGTASQSSVLKIENGIIEKLSDFEEPMVTALSAGKDKIYAGTASPARLYEIRYNGEKKLIVDLNSDLVNSILSLDNGDLIAATGKPAKLFLISPVGEIRKTVSIPADHSKSILPLNGSFYLGTSNPASLYRFDKDFNLTLISNYDGEEVSSLVPYKDGIAIALNSKKEKETGKILTCNSKSEIEIIASYDTILNSIWTNGKDLFAGGNNGNLYFFNGSKAGLCKRFEKPITQLAGVGSYPQLFFSSPPSFSSPVRNATFSYNSPVIDCGGIAKVGSLKFELSPFYKIFLRGGNTPVPDPYWTKWISSENYDSLPSSRYYQWRVEFLEKTDSFKGLTLAIKLVNRAPKIESAKIHPPGEIFVKNVSQLGDRLVQEIHDKERAFPEIAQSRPFDSGNQTYFLYGFRTISFTLSAPDGDDVRVKIEIKPYTSSKPFTLAENVKDNFFTFDARTLPDGLYSIILTASDIQSNSEEEAKNDIFELPLFEIDNTPPEITLKEEKNGSLIFVVKDSTSVRSGRLSRNGEIWKTVEPDGKAFGAKDASFTVKLKNDDRWLVFQAVDSFGNMSNCSWIKKD
ncbi:MAG: hypothetical protein N2445_00295 [Acidobacteria bacterium]|nr:hypothetical protein [Acidobacteriota bacterium]